MGVESKVASGGILSLLYPVRALPPTPTSGGGQSGGTNALWLRKLKLFTMEDFVDWGPPAQSDAFPFYFTDFLFVLWAFVLVNFFLKVVQFDYNPQKPFPLLSPNLSHLIPHSRLEVVSPREVVGGGVIGSCQGFLSDRSSQVTTYRG